MFEFQKRKFGQDLRQARLKHELTQRDVAEIAGVSHQMVSTTERGLGYGLLLDNYVKLCSIFDLDPADYFRDETVPF